MAVTTRTIKPNHATDQDFRDFIIGVRGALEEVGLVRTADTGQIDETTVLRPDGTNQSRGYDIFRFNDTLQATQPVFIKVEYGSGAQIVYHGLWITVGAGTNGAGTITAPAGTRAQIPANAADANLRTCRFSGANNRISAALFLGGAANAVMVIFAIERTHDADGADTDDAILFASYASLSACDYQQIHFAGAVPAAQSTWPVLVPPVASGVDGVDVGTYPLWPNGRGPLLPPMIGLLTYVSGDISNDSDIPVEMYGVERTYRTLAAWGTHSAFNRTGRNDVGPAIRYD